MGSIFLSPSKRDVQNVTVLNWLAIGSDHIMVRATIKIDVRRERTTLTMTKSNKQTTVDTSSEYQRTISEHLGNINEIDIETPHTSIRYLMKVARKKHCFRVNKKNKKLSTNTKHPMKQRREMLHKHPRK